MFKALKEIHTFNLEFYTQKKKKILKIKVK